MLHWAYAVTTIPQRFGSYLPAALASLREAGFSRPMLCIDGEGEKQPDWMTQFRQSWRNQALGVAGNWILSLYQLYVEDPSAERYAVFQDDILACRGLREYIERRPCPDGGYMNLLTFLDNDDSTAPRPLGWRQAPWINRGKEQSGRGAQALVFSREAVVGLLSSESLVKRFQDPVWGHRKIDAGVVATLNKIGFIEYIHNPSLVQHTGGVSSIKNPRYPPAKSFPGEEWDARSLLDTVSKSMP
jgi:hypothetical protein